MTIVEQSERARVVEYGRILPRLLAVVASHTDIIILVEMALHVLQLGMKHLLRTKNVGMLKVDQVANHLAALRPHVSGNGVAAVLVAHIVSAHIQLLTEGPGRQQQR